MAEDEKRRGEEDKERTWGMQVNAREQETWLGRACFHPTEISRQRRVANIRTSSHRPSQPFRENRKGRAASASLSRWETVKKRKRSECRVPGANPLGETGFHS